MANWVLILSSPNPKSVKEFLYLATCCACSSVTIPNFPALSLKCSNWSFVSLRVWSILSSIPNFAVIDFCSDALIPCILFAKSRITKSALLILPSLSFTAIPNDSKTSLPSPLSNFANSPIFSDNELIELWTASADEPFILAIYPHSCIASIDTPSSFAKLEVW